MGDCLCAGLDSSLRLCRGRPLLHHLRWPPIKNARRQPRQAENINELRDRLHMPGRSIVDISHHFGQQAQRQHICNIYIGCVSALYLLRHSAAHVICHKAGESVVVWTAEGPLSVPPGGLSFAARVR